MWMTNVSPTPEAGSPEASMSIPEESMATWPWGSRRTAKTASGGAGKVRCTSMRSSGYRAGSAAGIRASLHRRRRPAAQPGSVVGRVGGPSCSSMRAMASRTTRGTGSVRSLVGARASACRRSTRARLEWLPA